MSEWLLVPGLSLFFVVEQCTVIASLIMIFAGIPPCIEAYRKKDVSDFPFAFFLIGTLLAVNGVIYSIIFFNKALILLNITSVLVSVFYIFVYLLITKCNLVATTTIVLLTSAFGFFNVFAFNIAHSMYDFGHYVGLFGSCGYFFMSVLPIVEVVRCARTGTSSGIVLSLLIASTINSVCWILYSIMLKDFFMLAPNIPALAVNCLRFLVLALYPPTLSDKLKEN